MAADLLIQEAAAAMAGMARFGAASAFGTFRRRIGFDGALGRGSRRAKGRLFGVAFLVTQAGFKASDFFFQPINDPLLLQTAWAIAGLEFRREVLGGCSGVALFAVLAQEFRSHLIKELLQGLAVAQRLLQLRDHLGRDIHTTAPALFGKREDEGGMLVTPGTSWAIGTDAGFANLRQRTFNGRPKFFEISEEVLAEGGIRGSEV